MSYEVFKAKVNALVERAGGGINVRFFRDEENGRHFANCSDGTTIIGNEACLKVQVRWNGKNHQSIVAI